MRKNNHLKGVFFLFLIVFFFSCKENDDEKLPPVIRFKNDVAYTQNGSIIPVGHNLFFGIEAQGVSDAITNFTIKKILPNGTVITVMDTGLFNETLNLDKRFYQNVEDTVEWEFSVMDRNRLSAHVSLVIYKDPNSAFGGIYYYPSIKLGYQNNNTDGHFLNPSTGKVYSNDSATLNANMVDILAYFIISDNSPSPVLSSPGEMDNASVEAKTFYPFIENWSFRNYTLWDISLDNGSFAPLTAADFDAAQNDSLLIVSYHPVWGKKKFRWATLGKIIPFLTGEGKLGLIKVIRADEEDSGIIEIAVKIQQ